MATPAGVKHANKINALRSRTYVKEAVDTKEEILAAPAPKRRRPEVCTIYFVSTYDVPDYPIKIGLTVGSLEKRLRSLQTACPHKLCVLAAFESTPKHEWWLHVDLRPHRLNGEWFRRTPEVLAAVEEAIKNNHPARRTKGRPQKHQKGQT